MTRKPVGANRGSAVSKYVSVGIWAKASAGAEAPPRDSSAHALCCGHGLSPAGQSEFQGCFGGCDSQSEEDSPFLVCRPGEL